MSVLARLRTESKLQVYVNALAIRKKIIFLLLRDLGVKSKVRRLQIITKGMEEKDAEKCQEIAQKYGMGSFMNEYPEWIIEKFRNTLWDLCTDLEHYIVNAQSIWATNNSEAEERRLNMNKAISTCEKILKEFEMMIEILPIDANKYIPYVEDIEKEIALLKAWRKSDNKRNKTLGV